MAISGVFAPVLAKHSKSFNLIDTLAVGVDRIQRNFEPMQRQVEQWRSSQISDDRAKVILYAAFVDGELQAPRSLLPAVHRLYFEPEYPEFSPRTVWSLSNAFTSAFKKLDSFRCSKRLQSWVNFWRLGSPSRCKSQRRLWAATVPFRDQANYPQFATRGQPHVLRVDVDLNSIRAWLGHVSLDTTSIYAETEPRSHQKVQPDVC